jgi:hypothetical protein
MIDFTGIYRLDKSRNSMLVLAKTPVIIFITIFQEVRGTKTGDHVKNVSFVSYLFQS